MNSDSPRRDHPKCHPYDELRPSSLGLLANLYSLETHLTDAAKSHAMQHSRGDPADEDAPDDDHADAAESSAVQQTASDLPGDDSGDSTECSTVQHSAVAP